jgi:hypothetical protein
VLPGREPATLIGDAKLPDAVNRVCLAQFVLAVADLRAEGVVHMM